MKLRLKSQLFSSTFQVSSKGLHMQIQVTCVDESVTCLLLSQVLLNILVLQSRNVL